MNDLISIIVPIYNVEGYVSTCIDSLLRQTYPHLQIILVDDGSTDRSGAICDKYARQDTRIEVIHQENAGLSAARNSGLKRAIGELIAFVDGDDYVHPQMYDTLYRALRSGDYDFSMVLGKHAGSIRRTVSFSCCSMQYLLSPTEWQGCCTCRHEG